MTEQTHRPGLWSAPGDGVLARAGDLIVLSGPAEAAVLDRLLETLEQAAAAGADGRQLADAVEDILGDAGPVPVIALGPSGAGLVALLAGTAWAEVTTAEVRQALPAGAPGWLVRSTLPGPVLAIHAGLEAGQRDAARTDRYSRLDRGSVRAGRLSYYAGSPATAVAAAAADRDTEAHPAPPAAARRSPQERRALGGGRSSDVRQPGDDQAPAAGQPSDPGHPPTAGLPSDPGHPPTAGLPSDPGQPPAASVPSDPGQAEAAEGPARPSPLPAVSRPFADAVAEPSSAGADPEAPARAPDAGPGADAGPAPAPSPAPEASPAPPAPSAPPATGGPFEAVLLTGSSLGAALSETGERAPLPPAAEPAPAEPDAAEPMIMGAYCKNGHFDDPEARFCAVCGISMNQQTLVPRLGPRPPLGLLLLDTGAVLQLDADYVIGREPETDPTVMAGDARPLPIPDATGTLSRVHAQVQLVDWNVLVTDLGSANGTRIRRSGDSVAEQLIPRVPALLQPGCRVDLGGRRLHYESHRGR